ncbi:MAG: hypothetical protein H6649_06895 [Caldilineae bacterium]|nr:hypothetical protein [Caldilineae bacterium]
MTKEEFPDLNRPDWQATRDSMKLYARVVGKVRRALAPPEKHWWHVGLRMAAEGPTTGPIPGNAGSVELLLDFVNHQLVFTTSRGQRVAQPLHGQPVAQLGHETMALLDSLGIHVTMDADQLAGERPLSYDRDEAARLWQAFSAVGLVLAQFKGSLREETGPLLLWPHNFDLAFLWFSGRKVSGPDPADPENADEQMNFGFEPGDAGIPEPYFYVTAYPKPDGFAGSPLPAGAVWQTAGWTGAVLPYAELLKQADPAQHLLAFFRAAQKAGARFMKD